MRHAACAAGALDSLNAAKHAAHLAVLEEGSRRRYVLLYTPIIMMRGVAIPPWSMLASVARRTDPCSRRGD